jgi:hypothetical protein
MRLHATRKNLAPNPLDHEPSTCALVSSRSLPFIAPLRLRWSPVVLQRKMSSISFPFLPLRDPVPHNEGGSTPLPDRPLGTSATLTTAFNSFNFFALLLLRSLLRHAFIQLLSFQPLPHSFAKTTGGTYPSRRITSRRARHVVPLQGECKDARLLRAGETLRWSPDLASAMS